MHALITALMPVAIHCTARPIASAPVSAITTQCREVAHSHRLRFKAIATVKAKLKRLGY